MIEITPTLQLDDAEFQLEFIRSSGPGGQNVNKVSSACQLRWDVNATTALPPEVKARLLRLAGNRATDEGILIIEARRYRTQEQNKLDAFSRLAALVRQALQTPKPRKKNHPSVTSSAARVDEKKRRGVVKRTRRYNPSEWE